MSELGIRILGELDGRYATYRTLASILGEDPDRIKRACATLKRNGEIRVEYVQMNGCIKKAVVMKNDGRMIKKDERALSGAYVKGQTDLDGGMVVETAEDFVWKGDAPWRSTQKQ